jgi:hypothetical protein
MTTTKTKLPLTFKGYHHDATMTIPERTAHALDWAAAHNGGMIVPYNILLKAVMGYNRMPRLKTEEVEALRRKMSRARQLLEKVYGRALVAVTGIGVRATVDGEDAVRNSAKPAGARLERAAQIFKDRLALVNKAEVQDKELLAWLRGANAHVKQITAGSFDDLAKPKQIESVEK